MLRLSVVIEALTGVAPIGEDREIHDAAIDSRQVKPQSMFIALPGERVDGHDFIQEAFHRGATVALISRPAPAGCLQYDLREGWKSDQELRIGSDRVCLLVNDSLEAMQKSAKFWRKRLNLGVIGITGSVGKSTTKELVAEVLGRRYRTLKSPGNLNNEIGLPLTVLKLNEQHQRAVLEMGFYVPGEIKFLCDIGMPQVGVVTNIGTVHAERAGTIEDIIRGKTEIVQALPPAPDGLAILNFDDPKVRGMSEHTAARIFYYGMSPEAHLWADEVEGLGLDGIRLRLHYRNEIIHLRVPLIGRHSVHTVLRAAAVGLNDGLSWQEIVSGLQSGKAQLRLVAVRASSGAIILDDTYNASPESTLAALNLLDDLDGRKIAVLGDMLELGRYEQQGHLMVGARAAEVASELITIGERAKWIASSAAQSGMTVEMIKQYDTPEQSIAYLKDHLSEKDVVLVKGSRGMQMDSIVSALEAES
ncbi:MAG: UDP-N-acetylmuramoyl-tripeptide--D-alanyl-D-alanine ligase [Chloroflexota bacterium]|nr:MAG: UDP-N-acetylmuramoyl-tripeptide--D-alanyl-D-alanine ligase [Chloroflexota bacterium]